ncbi:MAG: hypothetical protein ACR2LV_12290 [Solirubrobacteraceae bacterium]
MTTLRAVPWAFGVDAVTRARELDAIARGHEFDSAAQALDSETQAGSETPAVRIDHLERELEGVRRESGRLHDLLEVVQRARLVAEQRAHAEHALRMEFEHILRRRINASEQVTAAARSARERAESGMARAQSLAEDAEHRAEQAESLAAGLERLLRDDTARCAYVYDAVQRLRAELDAARRMWPAQGPVQPGLASPRGAAHAAVLAGAREPGPSAAVAPDRLSAALGRLRAAAPERGEEGDAGSANHPSPQRWRARLHRWTRRLA